MPESSPVDATLHSFSVTAGGGGARDCILLLEMTPMQKPSSYHLSPSCYARVLRKEIAWLELEIMHLERHLISLYKNAYQQQYEPPQLPISGSRTDRHLSLKPYGSEHRSDDAASPSQDSPMNFRVNGKQLPLLPYKIKNQEKKNVVNRKCVGHSHSLADHLGSFSRSTPSPTPPDRLSEDIVKCISSIYYKLANPVSNTHTEIGITAVSSNSSASSSFLSSSSSTLYSEFLYDNDDKWSPPRSKRRRPYYGAIQVSNISCVDNDDTFQYAAKMLEKFRSLVKSLEKVDPRKMNREEKLAFWINIHNALAMHAHLAYGTQDRVKTGSLLKATYNVGGHCIDANIIQSSILGIRSHYSLPWLQTLFSPGNKFRTDNMKHVYAVEYPEPLVHFALCSGAYSDPAVRVYRAKNVFNDLKLAMAEFACASMNVHKDTKLVLPKIFSYFSKDMTLDVPGLLKVLCDCLPEDEQETRNIVTKSLNGSSTPPDKYSHYLPQSSTFRYIIHRQLAQEIISSL